MFPDEEMVLFQSLESHTDDVTWCDFSGRSTLVSGSADKTARIWQLNSNGSFSESEEVHLLSGHRYGINCVRFSPFGTVIATCSIDGSAILWNAQTGEQLAKLQHPSESAIRVCAFSPSSSLLATGSDDETAVLWDLSTRSIMRVFEGHEAMVACCAFSPDSAYLITGSTAGDLKIWDAQYGHGKCLATQNEAHDLGVLGCDFSSQFETSSASFNTTTIYKMATCGNDDLVKIWLVKAGSIFTFSLHKVLEGHSANVMCCTFSKDGSILASGSGDKSVIIWDPYSGEQLQKLEHHSRYITSCCFSSDGRMLASGSNDKSVLIWTLDKELALKRDLIQLSEPETEIKNHQREAIGPHVGASVKAVSLWSVDEVCLWLQKIGLPQYEETFKKNEIDGQELLHLTHESLNNSLKMEAMGHRNKTLRGIQCLKNPMWQHLAFNDNDGDMPEEFFCPITHEIMKEPVVAADGYSYEKQAITEWLDSGKTTSPMTNEGLNHAHIINNRVLSLLIQKYLM